MFTGREVFGVVAVVFVVQWVYWRWRTERHHAAWASELATVAGKSSRPGASEQRCVRCTDPEFQHDQYGCLQPNCRCDAFVPPATEEHDA